MEMINIQKKNLYNTVRDGKKIKASEQHYILHSRNGRFLSEAYNSRGIEILNNYSYKILHLRLVDDKSNLKNH